MSTTTTTSSTYSNQSELPRLPIPTLEETLERFPSRLAALQTTDERKETLKVTERFLAGEGPHLQKLLLQYEEEGRNAGTLGSFVEEFWNDSYLAPECSVVLNLNPFFLLEDGPDPGK
jgi:carnitine O-acetyltransferase